MPAKNLYLTNTLGDSWRLWSESTQTAASLTEEWVVGTGATNHSEYASGADRAETTFTGVAVPDGVLDTSLKDAVRIGPFNGYFDAGNWETHFVVRATTNGGAQDGRMRWRLIVANADGTSAREITSAQQQGALCTNVSTSADFDSNLTVSINGFACENQYLFFQLAWERTGAGGMSTADISMRTGSSTTVGTRVVTPNFTAASGSGCREFRNDFNEFDQRLTSTTLPSTVVDNLTGRAIVKMEATTLGENIWKNGQTGATNNGYGLLVDATNPRFQIIRDGSAEVTADANFSAATWYDVVIRRTAGTWKLFVNGAAQTGSGTVAPTAPAVIFSLGCRMENATTVNAAEMNGFIAEFAFWERALTAAEITDLYNSGTFKRSNEISTANLVRRWALGMGDVQESDEVGSNLLTHTGYPLVQAGPTFFGAQIPRLMTMGIG